MVKARGPQVENYGASDGGDRAAWSPWLTESPCVWPLARLFWSGRAPEPLDATDPKWVATVLSTILQEGTARDWRAIRWDAVWPIWDQLALDPRIRRFWDAYRVEGNAMDQRDQVLDSEQHHILGVAAQVLPHDGFELAGGTALAAGSLGHRVSDDLDIFTGDATLAEAVPAVETAWRAARQSRARPGPSVSAGARVRSLGDGGRHAHPITYRPGRRRDVGSVWAGGHPRLRRCLPVAAAIRTIPAHGLVP